MSTSVEKTGEARFGRIAEHSCMERSWWWYGIGQGFTSQRHDFPTFQFSNDESGGPRAVTRCPWRGRIRRAADPKERGSRRELGFRSGILGCWLQLGGGRE